MLFSLSKILKKHAQVFCFLLNLQKQFVLLCNKHISHTQTFCITFHLFNPTEKETKNPTMKLRLKQAYFYASKFSQCFLGKKEKKIVLKKDSFQQTIASLSSKIVTLTDKRLNFHSAAESLNAARSFFFFFSFLSSDRGGVWNYQKLRALAKRMELL